MKILKSIAVGFVFFYFLISANVGAVDVERTYSFGIIPHKNTRLMLHVWKPILRYLSKKTGVKLKLETGITEQLFKKVLYKGVYDFAYVNPYMLLKASDVQHYDAFARIQNKKVRAIIVTANTSTLQTINDLDIDVEMGFPKRAYSANFLLRALLLQHKKKVEPNFTLDASSGYFGVSNGILVVAGGDMKTFNDTDSVVKKKLRILWMSPAYTPNAFTVHPRVDKEVVQKLQKQMLKMNENPKLLGYLRQVGIKGIQLAQSSDWDPLRKLAPFLEIVDAEDHKYY